MSEYYEMSQINFIVAMFVEKKVSQVLLEWLIFVPSSITKAKTFLPKNVPDFWLKQRVKFNAFSSLIILRYLWDSFHEVDDKQTTSLTLFRQKSRAIWERFYLKFVHGIFKSIDEVFFFTNLETLILSFEILLKNKSFKTF